MRRPQAILEGFAGGLMVIFPPAAAGLLLLLGAIRRRRPDLAPWAWLWVGYLVPLLAVTLLAGRDPLIPALQALFGILIGALVVIERRRALALGIVLGLLATAAAGLVERELSRRLWWDASTPTEVTHLVSGVSEISGDSQGWTRNGVRLLGKTWTLSRSTAAPLELSFDIRAASERYGWQWYTNHPATRQELVHDRDGAFTRISGLEASIVRRVRTSQPLAGRTVRATVELRTSEPVACGACLDLGIRTFEPAAAEYETLTVDATWQEFHSVFTFPPSAAQSVFEVVIGASAVPHLDVRALRVEESIDGAWTDLGVPEPAGINLRVPVPGSHVFAQPTLNVVPGAAWQRQALRIPGDQVAELETLTALLQVEAGTEVQLRDIDLQAPPDTALTAVAVAKSRSALLFEQANLAGHSYVASGLLALTLVWGAAALRGGAVSITGTTVAAGITAMALLAAVAVSGSRTAFFAGVLGASSLVIAAARTHAGRVRRWLLVAVGLLAIGVGVPLLLQPAGELLGRLAFWQSGAAGANQVSRSEIWEVAVGGIREAPLAGWGADGFAELWRENHPDDGRAVPRHAHNFWLQLGVVYGLPGVFASLWLSVGLLLLARPLATGAALLVVVSLLVMQLFDHTLAYVGVLLPLITVLNVHRRPVTDPSSRSSG